MCSVRRQPVTTNLWTEEAYFAQERVAEERSEYVEGIVVPLPGGNLNHSQIVVNFVQAIGSQLKQSKCHAFMYAMLIRPMAHPPTVLS